MTLLLIWGLALLLYVVFWVWYIGFRKKITDAEVQQTMQLLNSQGQLNEQQGEALRSFFANDDGKDFVMVNLLHLQEPKKESRKKLDAYQKIFLGALLRKAGHPVMIARAASGNIEHLNCDNATGWTAAGMVRYRSRRDLMEMLPATFGSEHHHWKLEALEKTFAFPASPWFMLGGPKVVVPLLIILTAALFHIIVT